MFAQFQANFAWPWALGQCEFFFRLMFFLIHNESLEPLIDLLAYLDPKLWLKKQKLVKSVPTNANLG